MTRMMAGIATATEGNGSATDCHQAPAVETGGKRLAIRCLNDAIDASGVARKQLAEDCGWSEGHFSKVASGQQGELLDLAYRLPAHRAAIRSDFLNRLADLEMTDPLEEATEQLAIAAVRWFRAARRYRALPRRADRMAKVSPAATDRRVVNR